MCMQETTTVASTHHTYITSHMSYKICADATYNTHHCNTSYTYIYIRVYVQEIKSVAFAHAHMFHAFFTTHTTHDHYTLMCNTLVGEVYTGGCIGIRSYVVMHLCVLCQNNMCVHTQNTENMLFFFGRQ